MLGLPPAVVARCRQAEHTQGASKRQHFFRACDGSQQPGLRGTLGQASSVKAPTQGSQESQQQSYNRGERAVSLAQSKDLGLEPDVVHVEDISGNDRLVVPAEPAKRGGAWYAELGEDVRIAGGADEVPESVVVGLLASGMG